MKILPDKKQWKRWKFPTKITVITGYIAIASTIIGSIIYVVTFVISLLPEKKLFDENDNEFKILIVPFSIYGCPGNFYVNEIIERRLTKLSLSDSLNIKIKKYNHIPTIQFNEDSAYNIAIEQNANQVIYGVYYSNHCFNKEDEICINYITDPNYIVTGFSSNKDILISDFSKGFQIKDSYNKFLFETAKDGKLQENIDLIIYTYAAQNEQLKGNYLKSIELLLKAYKFEPYNTTTNYLLASNFYLIQEYKRAIITATNVLKRDSLNINALEIRGSSYLKSCNYNEAIIDLTELVSKDPTNHINYFERGCAYLELKRLSEAINDLNIYIKNDSINQDAYFSRGKAYLYNKEYNKAIHDFSKALLFPSKQAELFSIRGTTYFRMKKYEKAIFDYSKAIDLQPNNSLNYINRGRIYIGIYNNRELGCVDLAKAFILNKKNVFLLDEMCPYCMEIKYSD